MTANHREEAFERAWRDSKAIALSFPGASYQIAIAFLTTALPTFFEMTSAHEAILFLMGLIAGFSSILILQVLRAPYKQRDEARAVVLRSESEETDRLMISRIREGGRQILDQIPVFEMLLKHSPGMTPEESANYRGLRTSAMEWIERSHTVLSERSALWAEHFGGAPDEQSHDPFELNSEIQVRMTRLGDLKPRPNATILD